MRPLTPRLVAVALPLVALSLAPFVALANSRVVGIPGECEMTTYRVTVSADGKAGAPAKLFATQFVGGEKLGIVRSFQLAHDGKRIAYHTFGGVALASGNDEPKEYKGVVIYKTVEWSPDSKKLRYWTPDGLAIADADAQTGDKLKAESLYKTKDSSSAGWTPDGAVLLLKQHNEPPKDKGAKPAPGTSLMKVFASGTANELWKSDVPFYYFSVPSSRFENGSGPSAEPYTIVLGGRDALYAASSAGSERDKLCDFKSDGLQDIVQSPDSKKLLIRLNKDTVTDGGKTTLKGVILGHLDKWSKGKSLEFDVLFDKNDAHTTWISPTGKYATWASPDVVGFRELNGKPGSEVQIAVPGGQVKGCYWNKAETRIAIAAGNKLFLYDVAKKALGSAPICDMGNDPKSFVADPVFRGDDVVFTQFKEHEAGEVGRVECRRLAARRATRPTPTTRARTLARGAAPSSVATPRTSRTIPRASGWPSCGAG